MKHTCSNADTSPKVDDSISAKQDNCAETSAVQNGWRAFFHTIYYTLFTLPFDIKSTRAVAEKKVDISSMSFYNRHFIGLWQNLPINGFKSVAFFGTFSVLQKYLQDHMRSDQQAMAKLMALIGASMVEGVVGTPASLANTRMRNTPSLRGYKEAFTSTPREETQRAIAKGAFWAGLIRNPVFAAPYFFSLEYYKQHYICPDDPHGLVKTLAAGGFLGWASVWVSYPADVVMKRCFVKPNDKIATILTTLWGENGFKAFWKGASSLHGRMIGAATAFPLAMWSAEKLACENPFTLFASKLQDVQRAAKKAQCAPPDPEIKAELCRISVQ